MSLRHISPLLVVLVCSPAAASPLLARQVPPSLRAAADSLLAINRGDGDDAGWSDLSDATRLRVAGRIDRTRSLLRDITAADLSTPEALLLADNLREAVDASVASRVCRYHLWAGTSQFNGWHVMASNAARVTPVGTDEARERALRRFRALPARMQAERDLLRRGLDSGYTASADVIRAVVRQLDDLMPEDPTRSPLYAPAQRDSSATFRSDWTTMLTGVIYPAGRAWRDFLEKDYIPRARTEGSMARQRDGVACYAASLRSQTSVASNLDSLMRAARRDYDRVAADLAPLVRQLTGTDALGDGVRQLRSDPRFTFPSRDSILPAYRAMTLKAAGLYPRVVAGFQPESLAVTPYPEFQEKAGLPPQYLRPSEDGARPAQFLVNLSRTERMSVANAVSHEGYPGHHLQRIAANRTPVVHPVMRTLFVGGFTEGWGIYSERLADEMGLYETPLDRAGYLVHLLDVMVAAYLDVGYHTRGWSRAVLVDTMMVLGGRTRQSAEAYADRHAATPGQLATYYVGYQAISAYRESAARRLGSGFRAPEFHREVIRDGTVTLASLGAKVERWIASQQSGATGSGQSLEQRLQGKLDSLHQAGRFIGATAAVLLPDGRLISLAAGLSDSARRSPMRPQLRMLAGSTGKTFFAALAWQLASEGKLPLDAPISRWLGAEPWFDSLPNARQITVRQIMSHSSGLVRYELNPRFLADLIAQPARAYTPVEELRYLFGTTAAFAAGHGWDYSDTNYIVLAMILERITGTTAYEEIRRRFLEPLRLAGTIPSDRQVLPGLAQGYAGANNPFGPFDAVVGAGDRFAINPQFEWAGGGYASTSEDLAKWVRALYTGTVIDTAFLRRDVLQGVPAPMLGGGASYGLGVIIRDTPLGRAWGHSGFFPGYLTEMRWYPDRKVAIAVMVNQNRPGRGPAGLIADLVGLVMEGM